MPDDELNTMVREFRASVAAELDAQHRRIDGFGEAIRRHIATAETRIVKETREVGARLDRD